MAWNFRVRALGAAMVLFSMGAAEAALTEQQVNEALGSVPGVAWSVDGPDADAWTVTGEPALNVASAARDEVVSLTATVTGPGMLQLRTERTSRDLGLEVNGVLRPDYLPDDSPIFLGEGTQTVTWKGTHVPGNDNPVTMTFRGAKWEPFNHLPLSVGEADGSVKLSGGWIGQDRVHRGDGGAALFGGFDTSPGVLRGDFTGAGVVIYEINGFGEIFSLDGVETFSTGANYADRWVRKWYPAEAGDHVATWTTRQRVWGEAGPVVVAVDEVRVVPEVDLATAMDTPGRVWTSTTSGVWRALGVPMADAPGGNSVLLDSRVKLSSLFTTHGLLKVRYRLSDPEISLNGTVVSPAPWTDRREWQYQMITVPAGGGTIAIGGRRSLEVGGVEWFPLVGSVAEALGMPPGTPSSRSGWEIFASPSGEGQVVRTTLPQDASDRWIEAGVTGPARVTIDYSAEQDAKLAFLLDGDELWNSRVPSGNRVTLEVPAGEHMLRCVASRPPGGSEEPFVAEISRITVTPDEEVGGISEELGFDAKWAYVGEWERVSSPSFDGNGALKPVVPAGATGEVSVWLGTTVKGWGNFSFWRSQPLEGVTVTIHDDLYPVLEEPVRSTGWTVRDWWTGGGGDHKLKLEIRGTPEALAQFRLDEMNFEPELALSSIGSGPPLVWQNDEGRPWKLVKAPEGEPYAISHLKWDWEQDGTSRISTTVEGPGFLEFQWRTHGQRNLISELWVNGVKTSNQPAGANGSGEKQRIEITEPGASVVEWVAVPQDEASWMELRNVVWQPWVESSLASALDAPEGVAWESGGDAVFTGRPDANATNGTAAHMSLAPGQTSWLEATVEGPGVFDFKMPEPSGVSGSGWPGAANWQLTVDGVAVLGSTQQGRDPLWIRGTGTHKIRLTFTAPGDAPVSGFVDAVTWVPLVTRTMDASWTADVSEALNGYDGPDGGGFILRTGYSEPSWIEKTVTGPCEVTWNSQVVEYGNLTHGHPTVTVNGKAAVRILPEGRWDRNTLVLPAGTHVVRWSNVSAHGHLTGPVLPEDAQGSYWQISDPVVTPGVSPMAEAIDAPDSCWLVQGAEGRVITGSRARDKVDVFASEPDRKFYYLNLTDAVQKVSGWMANPWVTYVNWDIQKVTVDQGQSLRWAWVRSGNSLMDFDLDMVVVQTLPLISLDEAVDRPGGVTGTGWRGVVSAADSSDGVDCGWSFINDPAQSNVATMTVTSPGTVRFRWKCSSMAKFLVRLNGAIMPMITQSTDWEEVSFIVGNGTNRIEWEHNVSYPNVPNPMSEVWLDDISFEESEPWGLTEAAVAMGPGLQLTADAPADAALQWKAVRTFMPEEYQETSAARVASGASVMRATVTGPRVMSFQGWCFADEVVDSGQIRTRSEVITTWPTGYELTVRMDGNRVGGISHRDGVAWDYCGFMVPEGTHEITWQLSTVYNTGARVPATRKDLQGWISNIWFQSQKAAFGNWAANNINGPLGANEDPDGDGVNNLLEFAWNTRPGDTNSKPPQVMGRRNAAGNSYEVMVPYLSPFVTATLQSSTDMVTWDDHPVQWLESKPATGPHTATHQSVTIPVSPEDAARFFRMKVEAKE